MNQKLGLYLGRNATLMDAELISLLEFSWIKGSNKDCTNSNLDT